MSCLLLLAVRRFLFLGALACLSKAWPCGGASSGRGYWTLWPDGYARGGGLSNQIEQLLGRIQCAFHEDKPLRTLVLPDFRADRASPPRRYAFESLFDVESLRVLLDVVTWREFLTACDGDITLLEPGSSGECGVAPLELLELHAPGYELPRSTRRCRVSWVDGDADATRKWVDSLPRCAVGVGLYPLSLLGPCTAEGAGRRSFKSGRPCKRGPKSMSTMSPCSSGLDWSGSFNGTSFRGLINPERTESHFAPCDRTAIARLDASSNGKTRALLRALRVAKPIREAADRIVAHLKLPFDALHVRLGDFETLCAKKQHGQQQHKRLAKFCPPTSTQLSKLFSDRILASSSALVLSDDPGRAIAALGGGRSLSLNNASLLDATFGYGHPLQDSILLMLDVELATRSRTFVGVACSTVSQFIIKRRQAILKREDAAFYLWP